MIRSITLVLLLLCMKNVSCLFKSEIYSIVPHNLSTEYNKDFFSSVFLNIHTLDNGKIAVDLKATLKKNFPTDVVIKISVARKIKGKLVALGKPIQSNVCDFITKDKLFYPSLQKHSNFPTKCPVTPAEYYLKNYIVPTDKLPPVLPTGIIYADVDIFTKSKNMATIKIIGEIIKNNK